MGLFSRFKSKPEVSESIKKEVNLPKLNTHVIPNFPFDTLVPFEGDVLDTNNPIEIAKYKHNLDVLIKRTKEKNYIEKFMLIREDDFFPTDWEWIVSSHMTSLESEMLSLSYHLKVRKALEQAGLVKSIKGIDVPISREQEMEALKGVDKKLGAVCMPSRFRSTKHFTVNTPLEVTGDYNNVSTDRDFIVLDSIDNFLNSGYGYSIAYHDAYLDVTHEGLKISSDAVVLIREERYKRVIEDSKVKSDLDKRKVILFRGDESIAIDMVLAMEGALPSQVGYMYADYDSELRDIISKSIIELANKNNILYDKSHAGITNSNGGHFSDYYDKKNNDYFRALQEFVDFMISRFPEHSNLFTVKSVSSEVGSVEIIRTIGTEKLLSAILEYNENMKKRYLENIDKYKENRKNITSEMHTIFTSTIKLIGKFYSSNVEFETMDERLEIEEAITKFFHSLDVGEQLEASKRVVNLLGIKLNINLEEVSHHI